MYLHSCLHLHLYLHLHIASAHALVETFMLACIWPGRSYRKLAMFGRKRVREPDLEDVDPSDRLQARLQDMVSENMVPAERVRELLNDLAAVAPDAPRVLRRPGCSRNAARDLCRAFLRGGRWPEPYICTVRCRHVRTDAELPTKLAMALPHEYLHCLHANGDPALLYDSRNCDPGTCA